MSPAAAKKKVLISDKMSEEAVRILQESGEFDVVYNPEISHEDLIKDIGQYSALLIRSRTTVDKDVLANAKVLEVIGRAGVGVDNVDVAEATERGIIVMNTPDGNTLSTAEHTITMMLSQARRIAFADRTMKEGKWEKKGITGVEMFGKTLGICGLGRIGREVAVRAKSFGMRIVGYDPYLSKDAAEKLGIELMATVDEVVTEADMLTVHTPLTKDTKGMIGAAQIAKAKKGVMIINCARGGIVDEAALVEGLKSGKVGGAALDVFETEPLAADHPLRQFPNVTLTPHLAASTTEAQENVARDVALQVLDVLRGIVIRNAVNAPSVDAEVLKRIRPYLTMAEQLGKFTSQVIKGAVTKLEVQFSGAIMNYPQEPITVAALKGFLEPAASQTVNYVNARGRAKSRGLEVVETKTSDPGDFTSLVTLKASTAEGNTLTVSATLFGNKQVRIVRFDDVNTEINPVGRIIMIENVDKPGVIGSAAVLIGKHNINIAEMDLERFEEGGKAMAFFQVDGEVDDKVLEELRQLPNIVNASVISC